MCSGRKGARGAPLRTLTHISSRTRGPALESLTPFFQQSVPEQIGAAEQLQGVPVGILEKGDAQAARIPGLDRKGDAAAGQLLISGIDIIDLKGQMRKGPYLARLLIGGGHQLDGRAANVDEHNVTARDLPDDLEAQCLGVECPGPGKIGRTQSDMVGSELDHLAASWFQIKGDAGYPRRPWQGCQQPSIEHHLSLLFDSPACTAYTPCSYRRKRGEPVAQHESATQSEQDPLWRGIDLSGITVVLGPAGGMLLQTLAEQAAAIGGETVIAIGYEIEPLQQIQPLAATLPLAGINARIRQLPLLDESVDLLVMNGTLRQVPLRHLETMLEELWRVLVPGGQLRIADIMEPSEVAYNEAWRLRNEIVSMLGQALEQPVALYVNLRDAAAALTRVGFEELSVTLLPGMPLTEGWLEATREAVQAMASRVGDPALRRAIIEVYLPELVAAYQQGEQRAAERFVLSGRKIGDLALNMQASFTEDDLVEDDDD